MGRATPPYPSGECLLGKIKEKGRDFVSIIMHQRSERLICLRHALRIWRISILKGLTSLLQSGARTENRAEPLISSIEPCRTTSPHTHP